MSLNMYAKSRERSMRNYDKENEIATFEASHCGWFFGCAVGAIERVCCA